MEISAMYPTPPPSSISLQASFCDQSHLQFYGSSPCFKTIDSLTSTFKTVATLTPVRPRRFPPRAQAACNTCASTSVEQDLLNEIADLKGQMKQKKKLLKTHMKEKKKAQKQNMVKAKGCSSSSSSSSSSESSDGECETVNMKLLRQEMPKSSAKGGAQHSTSDNLLMGGAHAWPSCAENAGSAEGTVRARLGGAMAGKIEVCIGGKCKKAGSEHLLSSLRRQIPSSCSVEAMPCKCMSKCGMAINVKVQKNENNSQHHSYVGVGDASLILSHHFGLGPPPSGLPSFGACRPCLAPQILTSSAST